MSDAIRGRLLSGSFVEARLEGLEGVDPPPASFVAGLDGWSERVDAALGPASSLRALADVAVIPLLRMLGFAIETRVERERATLLHAVGPDRAVVPVLVTPWSEPLDGTWRDALHEAIRADARWGLSCNGRALRVIDAHRAWSRRFLELDLRLATRDESARLVLWSLARAEALALRPTRLELAADLSARYGVAVCRALGRGVLDALALIVGALRRGRTAPRGPELFEQSLTMLYRILFLLFAEARALVPVWHPIYRERYTVGAILAALLAGGRWPGIWETILAVSRLAHAGCRAGDLCVAPFNGRLFSPGQSPVFHATRIGDPIMRRVIVAVGTAPLPSGGRNRIPYADLDVEQLGAVYEHVLEYQPATEESAAAAALVRTRDLRQSTGTFYTPRALTAYLVRRTLEPLVRGRSAGEILSLRVLDPAMGSGAFLVAACRYLADAVEASLVREGRWHPGEATGADRAALRREVSQRCLFGVDVNPMAAQLARLSLWLASLAADKPLTFLDHHLVTGDSLVGADFADLGRQPPRGDRSRRPAPLLPLFPEADLASMLAHAAGVRAEMALEPDDSPGVVAGKTRRLAALHAPASPLGQWRRVLDLWCAGWFWQHQPRLTPAVFGALCDQVLRGHAVLPAATAASCLAHAAALAERHRFLHWPLAFPEVFENGGPSGAGRGFDAVIGNPPWDMVRGDSGPADTRTGRRQLARQLVDFTREAGVYRLAPRAHVNRYQLFLERSLQLTRPGGRIGLVLPSGFTTDAGAAPLRLHLFDRASVDSVTGLDNRGGFFPIHRSLRFVLVTATTGTPTTDMACRFGITSADALESDAAPPLIVRRDLLARVSGRDDLAIPEMATERDLRIVEHVSARTPWLGAAEGWSARFGRELNATDDRHLFRARTGDPRMRPVLDGRQVAPFRVDLDGCVHEIAQADRPRLPRRARLAYRDVAAATNRLTLIAAIVPARAVTTHTLFCLKTPLTADEQHVLCALLNSFVANYLVRLRVNTHVSASLIARLPVPRLRPSDRAFATLLALSRALAGGAGPIDDMPEYAALQALAARLYGLRAEDFEHVLGTLPLIPGSVRDVALKAFHTAC